MLARPSIALLIPEPEDYSFPSGHTYSSFSAAFGLLPFVAAPFLARPAPCFGNRLVQIVLIRPLFKRRSDGSCVWYYYRNDRCEFLYLNFCDYF